MTRIAVIRPLPSVADIRTLAIALNHVASAGRTLALCMGGEFCPLCAAERWALATVLSRFGTFQG